MFFWHVVGIGGPKLSKNPNNSGFFLSTTKKKSEIIFRVIGFYRKVIPNFAMLALPLTDLTSKKKPNNMMWTDDLDRTFKKQKNFIVRTFKA